MSQLNFQAEGRKIKWMEKMKNKNNIKTLKYC